MLSSRRITVLRLCALIGVALIAPAATVGCASGVLSPSSAQRPSTPMPSVDQPKADAPASVGADEPLDVGELYRGIPSSIGDFQLLTPESVETNAMSCTDSPLDFYVGFWSGGDFTSKLIYIDNEGVANTSDYTGPCWAVRAAVAAGLGSDTDETFPGVIEVTFGSLDYPVVNAEVECRSTELITGCSKRYPGFVTAVSVKEAVGDDTEAQGAYLTRFLHTFVQAHPGVAEKTAGFGSEDQ